MIVVVLFVLILLCDILALKDILTRSMKTSMKVVWSLVVLVFPIIGLSLYYFAKWVDDTSNII